MKLIVKIIAAVVVLFLLVLIAAGIYVKFFVSADDLRAAISSSVEKSTGRTMAIEGDLDISVFPWIKIAIGRTRLGEDPAFGEGDFLSFDAASVGVKLMPIFSGNIEMDKVSLDGLSVNMIRNKAGVGNWESLSSGEATEPPADASGESSFFKGGQIGGLEIDKRHGGV